MYFDRQMERPSKKFSYNINDLDYDIKYAFKEKPSRSPIISQIPRDLTRKSDYQEQPGYLVQLPYFYRSGGLKRRNKSVSFKTVTGRKDRNSI